jgi:hypothetical protein
MFILILLSMLNTSHAYTTGLSTALNNHCLDTWCEGEYSWHFEGYGKNKILIRQFGENGHLIGKTIVDSGPIDSFDKIIEDRERETQAEGAK